MQLIRPQRQCSCICKRWIFEGSCNVWLKVKPGTEVERINDEMKRQASQCTCNKQFRIHKIGEGKYRVSNLGVL